MSKAQAIQMADDAELDLVGLLVPFVDKAIFYYLSWNSKEPCPKL